MKRLILLAAFLAGGSLCQTNAQTTPDSDFLKESPAAHDARMKWFREARFGMFIHWGLFTEAAGYWNGQPVPGAGEWAQNDLNIPLSQYAKLVPEFDPEKFNADDWVKTAKDAGMKYIVITTKHHEGFVMWPSKLTDWGIASTPFRRDPLKELAGACRREGIRLCFYYSIMDWHSPLYAPRKPWNDIATNSPDMDAYVAYMKGQLKELLSNYGPVGILWFDGCWEKTWTRERGVDLYNYLRSLQPDIIVNNRVGSTSAWEEWFRNPQQVGGDYGTPEQAIPVSASGTHLDWETCMTMNDTWGFKRQDHNWKSTTTLVRNLIDCASKGGNYLLNVGPTPEGVIPEASVTRLQEVGRWMKVNGDAIYGTTASPFSRPLPWGRCTVKAGGDATTLYLHVFDWPDDGELLVPNLKNRVASAVLLATGEKLDVQPGEDGVTVAVPKQAPDQISSTVVLTIAGPPDIAPMTILQKKNGTVDLPASLATLHGSTFRYESGGPLDDIGYWTDPNDWADWQFKLKQPGKYEIDAVIAAPASGSFEISAAGKTWRAAAPTTANYIDFKPVKLGTLEVASAGDTTLCVRPVADGWQPMNLKLVRLVPVNP
jgi:alpha-L-fucosidase